MRRLVPALIAVVFAGSAAALLAPSPADAAGCVTSGEYQKIRSGMTQAKVHDVFGTSGWLLFKNPGAQHNEAREYRMCTGGTVQVQYNNYATHGGRQRVAYKQIY